MVKDGLTAIEIMKGGSKYGEFNNIVRDRNHRSRSILFLDGAHQEWKKMVKGVMNTEKNDKAREKLADYLYGISKATFTAMVLGSILALFGFTKGTILNCILSLIFGLSSSIIIAYIANRIMKGERP